MFKKYNVLLLVPLSVGVISCEKLPTAEVVRPFEGVKFADAIPLEYGTLVAVTPGSEGGTWAALWFEKQDKTITTVWVNNVRGQVGRVATISRK